jgi:ABC-type nitrate/sulfonate/bicarbonate transport system permease component
MRYSHILHKSRNKHTLFHWQSILTVFLILTAFTLFVGLSGAVKIDRTSFIIGLMASFSRVSIAYVIAFILSILISLIVVSNKIIEAILLPIFDVLQSFPSFILFPVLVFALNNQPNTVIIFVLVITMIWPLLFAIISGVKGRRNDLEEAATVFGAVGPKRFLAFTFPMLLPSIITGSIVSWGEGWEFIIGAELLVSTHFGVGKYLGFLADSKQNQPLFFGIFLLLFFLFILNKLIWLPLLHTSTKYQADA